MERFPVDDAEYSAGIRVNGEYISEREILAEVQYHPGEINPLKKAADALVIRSLLTQAARKLEIAVVPQKFGAQRTEVEEEALIRTLIEHRVAVRPVEESQIRKYYESHPEKFQSPEIFEAKHILYAADVQNPEQIQKARSKAIDTIKMLHEKPERFEKTARTESDCTSGRQGGYLGQFLPGQMEPNFEAALRGLAEGEIGETAVQTIHGFHVVQLVHRESGRRLPFENVREKIADFLNDRQWRSSVRSFLNELVQQADISGWSPSDTVEY